MLQSVVSNINNTRWDAININPNGASIIAIQGTCGDLINGVKGKLYERSQAIHGSSVLNADSPLRRQRLLQQLDDDAVLSFLW
jgi:hypothetical protein